MKRLILLAAMLATITGCATMSENECASADWETYGYQDGANGLPMDQANRRAAACQKHGVQMDHAAYRYGRDQGLVAFCVPNRAYEIGERGGSYPTVCYSHGEQVFRDAYDQGYERFTYTSAVSVARRNLSGAEREVQEITELMARYATGYREKGVTPKEHNAHVVELLARRVHLTNEVIPEWKAELRFAQKELDAYELRNGRGSYQPPYSRNDAPSQVYGQSAY